MGMAASQARLLTITARMHDVEYQAQSIQNAKIALATQQDQIYQDYLAALDQTTFTVKDNNGATVVANFKTLCGIDAAKANKRQRYVLRDEFNRIIVDDKIAAAYNNFKGKGNGAYEFAMYMMTGESSDFDPVCIRNAEKAIFDEKNKGSKLGKMEAQRDSIAEQLYKLIGDYWPTGFTDGNNFASDYIKVDAPDDSIAAIKNDLITAKNNIIANFERFTVGVSEYTFTSDKKEKGTELIKKIETMFQELEYNMYTQYGEEIFEAAENNKDDFDNDDFWYYVNMFKQIEANGDAIVKISSFNGLDGIGDAASDSDWLQQMVQSGKITIDISNLDNKGAISFSATGVPSDDSLNYTTTSTIDKTKLAKVEAEYEHNVKIIDQKDKKFDMDLNKLETERTALKTEYDSVKKVIEDNIERTFGIFS